MAQIFADVGSLDVMPLSFCVRECTDFTAAFRVSVGKSYFTRVVTTNVHRKVVRVLPVWRKPTVARSSRQQRGPGDADVQAAVRNTAPVLVRTLGRVNMRYAFVVAAALSALTLSACERATVVVPAAPAAAVVVPVSGPAGPQGAPGAPVEKGDTDATGATGSTGMTGATGSTGMMGVEAAKGEKGKKGGDTIVLIPEPARKP